MWSMYIIMPTNTECICRYDLEKVHKKNNELKDSRVYCITEHPRFSFVCCDVEVLQVAHCQYLQEYGLHHHHHHYRNPSFPFGLGNVGILLSQIVTGLI